MLRARVRGVLGAGGFVLLAASNAGCPDQRTACARLTGAWATVDVEAPGEGIAEVLASVQGTRFVFEAQPREGRPSRVRLVRTSPGAAPVTLASRVRGEQGRSCELEYEERGATVRLGLELYAADRVRLRLQGFPFAQVLARE